MGYTPVPSNGIIGSSSINVDQALCGNTMPIQIDGHIYYRTCEACASAGISRATLFRWLKAGILKKTYRDRRGWRIFTDEDLAMLQAEAKRIEVDYIYVGEIDERRRYNQARAC